MTTEITPSGATVVDEDDPIIMRHRHCRVCHGVLTTVFNLGAHYISEFPTTPTGHAHPRIPLELCLCGDCGLVQLRHTANREWMYREYWYRSGVNESMIAALKDVVISAVGLVELQRGDTVIDIGANDGTLLAQYLETHEGQKLAPPINRIGVDPARNLHELLAQHCDIIVPDYFPGRTNAYNGAKAKIITSIAMFYDLQDPGAFTAEIARVLHRDGVWVVQLGDLLSMIKQNAFDAICHEHLEYWSLTSLMHLVAGCGLFLWDVEQNMVNDGSLRVYIGKKPRTDPAAEARIAGLLRQESAQGLTQETTYHNFGARVQAIKARVMKALHRANGELERAPIDVYGASTKGNTLLQAWGIDHHLIRAAVERSPAKHGRYTVGSGIPIMDEETWRKWNTAGTGPALTLVLPWHFKAGILARETEYLGYGGKFLFPLPEPHIVRTK